MQVVGLHTVHMLAVVLVVAAVGHKVEGHEGQHEGQEQQQEGWQSAHTDCKAVDCMLVAAGDTTAAVHRVAAVHTPGLVLRIHTPPFFASCSDPLGWLRDARNAICLSAVVLITLPCDDNFNQICQSKRLYLC